MGKKISTFFPNYTLRENLTGDGLPKNAVVFQSACIYYLWSAPWFGMTEMQRRVMQRLALCNLPPIMSIAHARPTHPDQKLITDPHDSSRQYFPYAMADVTVRVMSEREPRVFKVYLCNCELLNTNPRSWIKSAYFVGLIPWRLLSI